MTEQLGRYEIVSELGRGAMGLVYKAVDPLIDRPVAIKTINLNEAKSEREDYEQRFYQEARAAGQLSHRNIVTIYDVGRSGDVAYIAMEFIEGSELRSILDQTPVLPVAQAANIASQVAQGLAYAHERAIVHRDVKPSNVMVATNGDVKIMDFGIARMSASAVRTQSGMVFGTPKYMSPEQVIGRRADQRSDIFSLGVMLYEMLTGRPPFAGETIDIVTHHTLHAIPPPPSALNPGVPPVLDFIVAKAMAKRPDDRYQTAQEMLNDLDEFRAALADSAWIPPPAPQSASAPGGADTLNPEDAAEDGEDAPGPEALLPSLGVSSQFDSFVATIRMAAMTYEGTELKDFTSGLDVTPPSMAARSGDTWPMPARAGPESGTARGKRSMAGGFLRWVDTMGARRHWLWITALLLILSAIAAFWL
jgi:serine/threonine protein kinase